MEIIYKLLLVLLSLVSIGIDIAIFFLLIRLILMWRNASWLERFNNAGKGLVDAVSAKTGALWFRVAQKRLSKRGELIVSLVCLLAARIVLSEIIRLF